jgi:hypothetical protein
MSAPAPGAAQGHRVAAYLAYNVGAALDYAFGAAPGAPAAAVKNAFGAPRISSLGFRVLGRSARARGRAGGGSARRREALSAERGGRGRARGRGGGRVASRRAGRAGR